MKSLSAQSEPPQLVFADLPKVLELVRRNLATGRCDRVLARFGDVFCQEAAGAASVRRLPQLNDYLARLSPDQVGADLLSRLTQDVWLQFYVLHVHDAFRADHGQLDALLAEEPAAWNELRTFLRLRARANIQPYARYPGRAWLGAEDVVQRASMAIQAGHFPYDVSFAAWCSRLVANLVHAAYRLSRDLHDHRSGMVSIDALIEARGSPEIYQFSEILGRQSGLWQRAEMRMLLEDAVSHIHSTNRRRVVVKTYFAGWSDAEIAWQLGTSLSNVYVLRHRALKELRAILEQEMTGYW